MRPTFRRIKIQATVETAVMLLPETEIAHTIGALKQRLEQLDLTIVSFDSIEASGRHEVPSTSRLRRTA